MIRTLRRKVVAVVMVLVGLVLAAMLGYSYWSSYTMQWGLVDESLERALHGDGMMPVIGGSPLSGEFDGEPDDFGEFGGLFGGAQDFRSAGGGRLVARVMIAWDGTVISMGDAASVDEDVLDEVIFAVQSSDADGGRLSDVHVAWRSEGIFGAGQGIAIADTSDVDELLHRQALTSVVTFLGGLVALFAVVWPLSAYILRPVEDAWTQQRRFVADASHELKTPLAVIVANMGILSQKGAVPRESERWVEGTETAAKQMQGLVGELLELARTDETISGDAGAMTQTEVDFSDVVESVALEFDAVAFERGCSIAADIQPGICLKGDRDWLFRLARILIDNAVKYAREGSVVQVSLVPAAGRGSVAALSVTNQGEPIAPEDLPHVFDRFYRSDAARSRSTGGFGLGLAIAKGIAEAHGGSILVKSDAADGTTFTVRL